MTRKRILFVRPTLGTGGADRVTLNLLQQFDRKKYEVSLALMKKEGVLLPQVPEDVQVLDMEKKSLYRVLPVLISFYKSKEYDVIYSTSSGMSVPLIIAKMIAGAHDVLTVVSERSSLERRRQGGLKNRVLFALKCWFTARADYIVAVSDSIYGEISKYTNASDKQMVRAYNPIIPENIDQLMQESVINEPFIKPKKKIVAIGRLEKVKNFNLLLQSFAEIQNKETELFILGVGTLLPDLQADSAQLGIDKRVHFLGYQENVYAYLAKADVFILTSDFEGMPGALIQAMACGVPCVARDCDTGPRELIEDGENGFLIPMTADSDIATRVNLLLGNTDLAKSIGEKGKDAVTSYRGDAAVESYFSFIS